MNRPLTPARFANAFDEAAAETAIERIAAAPTPMAGTQIRVLGGAVARVRADATATSGRDQTPALATVSARVAIILMFRIW